MKFLHNVQYKLKFHRLYQLYFDQIELNHLQVILIQIFLNKKNQQKRIIVKKNKYIYTKSIGYH
jgi:hypothetical protein